MKSANRINRSEISSHGEQVFWENSLQKKLNLEIHTRPAFPVSVPAEICQLVIVPNEASREKLRIQLEKLNDPNAGIEVEEHTEFFVLRAQAKTTDTIPFNVRPLDLVNKEGLSNLAGKIVSATQIAIISSKSTHADEQEIEKMFTDPSASYVIFKQAKIWTDFKIQNDQLTKILIVNDCLKSTVVGRLVQRLFEIDSYVMLSLLGLSLVKDYGPEISEIESQLVNISTRIQGATDLKDQSELLVALTKLADRTEHIAAAASFRFGATKAYYKLVDKRIQELAEERIQGRRTLVATLSRRGSPAVDSVFYLRDRLEKLSQRVERFVNLLVGRIELDTAVGNRKLLSAMNSRSAIQFRIQKFVEGISVFAISYYSIGLLEHLIPTLKALGLNINFEILQGVCVVLFPVLALTGIWFVQKRGKVKSDSNSLSIQI